MKMKEDDDVLLKNDPLAIYLKSLQCDDFETASSDSQYSFNDIVPHFDRDNVPYAYEELKIYFDSILKSELLLVEDYDILEAYCSNKLPIQDKLLYKISLSSAISLLGGILFKYTDFKIMKLISPFCSVPLILNIYYYIQRKFKNRNITVLLQSLNKLTSMVKKCLRLVGEYSATIGYYSSATINVSSINVVYTQFAKQFCTKIIHIIKLLAFNSAEIVSLVPLIIENNFKSDVKNNLFLNDDVNVTDLKLLYELYLLVQSDFIKTLGLAFCSNLWLIPNCNIDKIITENILSLTILLNKDEKDLESEYNVLRNFGLPRRSTDIRSPRKFKNEPIHYVMSCLHNAEIHFQQLLTKSRDIQNIIVENGNEAKNEIITTLLHEMDTQVNSSKDMVEAITKYFNQLQKKTYKHEMQVTTRQLPATIKTVENQEEELLAQEKSTYELYIPKEGLDLTDIEIDAQPVFSMKDLDYSGILLQELRTILRIRNPEIFDENSREPDSVSDSESEEKCYISYKQKNVFRPIQPVGLAENLQTIEHVLAARKNMLQCEDICGDVENYDSE